MYIKECEQEILAAFYRKNYAMLLLSCLCFVSCQLYSSCPHAQAILMCLFSLSYCLTVRNQTDCVTCMAFLGRRPNCCIRGTRTLNVSPGERIFPLKQLRDREKKESKIWDTAATAMSTHFHLISICMGKTSCCQCLQCNLVTSWHLIWSRPLKLNHPVLKNTTSTPNFFFCFSQDKLLLDKLILGYR